MSDKTFLFVTGDPYPEGSAGALRTKTFAQLLLILGVKPIVIGMGKSTDFSYKVDDGVKYCSLRYPERNIFYRLLGRVAFCGNMRKKLREINVESLVGIMYVSGGLPGLYTLKQLCGEKNIPLYFDSVEQYSPCEFSLGRLDPRYIYNCLINTRLITKDIGVIAVSEYLERHFKNRGNKTVRIPFILDTKNLIPKYTDGKKIKIVYGGSPGRKDRLKELITALGMLDDSKLQSFDVEIIGITEKEYEKLYGEVIERKLCSVIRFYGRQSREYTVERLSSADFSFLLRPSEERYAKAGFPTKVTEALSLGIPMLCNISSDLEIYLQDGINSVIIDKCSAESCLKALNRLCAMTREEIFSMKKNARLTAEEKLDIKLYQEVLSSFLGLQEK